MTLQDKSYIHGNATETRGRIHRSWLTMGGPLLSAENSNRRTLWENWMETVTVHGDRDFLAERYLTNGELGGFVYKSYKEIDVEVQKFRSGMVHLGLNPREHIAIYSKNRTEWQIVDIAMQSIGVVTVPLYDTLGPGAAEYVMENAECVACVTEMNGLENVLKAKNSYLKIVVVLPPRSFDTEEEISKYEALLRKDYSMEKFNVVAFDVVLDTGKRNPSQAVPPTGNELATLCYTSGTTGISKGVTLTHNNVMTDCQGIQANLPMYMDDILISYLPLAHAYERILEINCILAGGKICYFRGNILVLLEDIAACQPTCFCGVPRLYNRIYDKIMTQINTSGFIKRNLFHWAYDWKKKNLEADGATVTSSFDFVFTKIRAVFGGNVRVMVTGSAPISPVIMEFLRLCFSCKVVEGYGQTETACCVTSTLLDDQSGAGFVGAPIACSEVALFDVPEMNYTHSDMVGGKLVERGEICFRGPNMTAGYWKMPEKTQKMIDAEGWLHSGDIGMWLPNGYLKIIDRKKNIFKLSQGEYVAPEKIENVYAVSSFIAQAFVDGNSLKPSLVAIIVPDEEVVIPWLKNQGIDVNTLSEACKQSVLKQTIQADMRKFAKESGLHGFEQAKAIHLHDQLFTHENGLLTPTFKLKRAFAKEVFEGIIIDLYKEVPRSKSKL